MRDPAALRNEIRYAERLCQRTARLYRRVHWAGVFLGIIGGSAAMASLSQTAPHWLTASGGCFLALFFAVNLSVRPLEKALANEADVRRYAALRTASFSMSADDLEAALATARETDAAEIETLRNVALNDVLQETGNDAIAVPLSRKERFLGALA